MLAVETAEGWPLASTAIDLRKGVRARCPRWYRRNAGTPMDESSTSIKPSGATPSDVPAHVFESFLQALEASGASAELVARLRKTLLVDKVFTDKAFKEALFPEPWDL